MISMDGRGRALDNFSRSVNSVLVNWQPWSELKISGLL
jgi:hypothetical protein